MMVVAQCEYTKNHIVHIKMVKIGNFILCKFYLNFFKDVIQQEDGQYGVEVGRVESNFYSHVGSRMSCVICQLGPEGDREVSRRDIWTKSTAGRQESKFQILETCLGLSVQWKARPSKMGGAEEGEETQAQGQRAFITLNLKAFQVRFLSESDGKALEWPDMTYGFCGSLWLLCGK